MSRSQRGKLTDLQSVRTQAPQISEDEGGLWTLREVYEADESVAPDFLPQPQDPHPQFPQLVRKEMQISYLNAGRVRWAPVYRGIITAIGDPLPPDVWTSSSVAQQEDITTHPNFNLLRDVAVAASGYRTDDLGIFAGFTAPASIRGLSAWLLPSVTITRRRFTRGVPPNSNLVGKIENPGGPLAGPLTSGNQNWLKIGFETEQFGTVWQVVETWLRSGDNGWLNVLYQEGFTP